MREGCRGVIASYVNGRAWEPGVRLALEGLGYRVVWAATQGRFDDSSWPVSLRLADERHLERLPALENDPDTPIVALTGSRPRPYHDRRIAGRIRRPVSLGEIYPVLQQTLEPHPREAPRAPARLVAQLGCMDRRWSGDVLTISERGCLVRSRDRARIPRGAGLNLRLCLPSGETLSLRARSIYRADADEADALLFEEPSLAARSQIARYVSDRLAVL